MSRSSTPSVNSLPEPRTPTRFESVGSAFSTTTISFLQSPILFERGLDIEKLDKWGKIQIKASQWKKFVAAPSGRINVSIVREFYLALSQAESVTATHYITVRGRVIPFSSFLVNQVFNIPPLQFTPNPHFEFKWEISDMGNYITRYREACQSLFPSYHLDGDTSAVSLSPHLKAWKQFVNSRVYPTDNFQGITDDELFLLYAIATGEYVDWGILIYHTAVNFARNRRNPGQPMPFGWMITKLCMAFAGTEELISDEIFPTRSTHFGLLPVETPGCSD